MDPARFTEHVTDRLQDLLCAAVPHVPQPGLLVGLSGGPDSTALLLAAHRWAEVTGGTLAAAHFHHGLRGEAADRDRDFCADLCRRLGVPLHEGREDPRPLARSRGGGVEEAARHLRRRFMTDILDREPGLHAVATGHHRDDQGETVIMRLLRGTGPDGLAGIRPQAGHWIHPLLEVGRNDVLAYLQAEGQPWRDDATNLEGGNTRARLRREVLPLLREVFGPGVIEAAARLAELQARDLAWLESRTAEALTRCRRDNALDVEALLALEHAVAPRVLRAWLGAADLTRVHVDGTLAWLADGTSGSSLDLPGGRRLQRDFDRLTVAIESGSSGRNAADYRIVVRRLEAPTTPAGCGDPDDESTWSLTCPADALQGSLRVRNWREGDRMQPFGLDGTKKLSDLFREKKLPAAVRPGLLVVTDDAGILWCVGVTRAERTRVLSTTGAAVTLNVVRRRDENPSEQALDQG